MRHIRYKVLSTLQDLSFPMIQTIYQALKMPKRLLNQTCYLNTQDLLIIDLYVFEYGNILYWHFHIPLKALNELEKFLLTPYLIKYLSIFQAFYYFYPKAVCLLFLWGLQKDCLSQKKTDLSQSDKV